MAFDIKVINIKDPVTDGYLAIQITRPHILGNPYFLSDESKREECIEQFKQHLWRHLRNPESPITKILVKYADCANDICLVCYCKPKKCHGDVIKAAIEWIRNNRHSLRPANNKSAMG